MDEEWIRSSFCDTSACVEVRGDGTVLVRNSNRPEIWVEFTAEEWRVFLKGVRDGQFG